MYNDKAMGADNISMGSNLGLLERANWKPRWIIEKYNKDMELYETEEIEGNIILIEGMEEFMKVACGIGGTAFSSANAYIGVGDGTTAVVATQTGLMGTNKTYRPMDSTFPQVSGNVMTFRSTFGPTFGNHKWREFTVANGSSDTAKNLNRLVEAPLREKVAPDTWVVSLQITIS